MYEDVKETIEKLKELGYIIGAISNGDITQQTQKLEKTGIRDLFTYIDTSSEMPFSKPNPKVFETVLEKYNIDYSEFFYIGDSYKKDNIPCQELGIKSIHINRKDEIIEDSNLIQVKTLKEILAMPIINKQNCSTKK